MICFTRDFHFPPMKLLFISSVSSINSPCTYTPVIVRFINLHLQMECRAFSITCQIYKAISFSKNHSVTWSAYHLFLSSHAVAFKMLRRRCCFFFAWCKTGGNMTAPQIIPLNWNHEHFPTNHKVCRAKAVHNMVLLLLFFSFFHTLVDETANWWVNTYVIWKTQL